MWILAPFIWGILEATLLFMVPDVPISIITYKRGASDGLKATFAAAIGAAIGGIFMYYWGVYDVLSALSIIEKLPAISPQMIAKVNDELNGANPFWAMLFGSFTGTPYKIYATLAPVANIPVWLLFLMTPLVRLPRLLLAVVYTKYGVKFAAIKIKNPKIIIGLLFGFWLGFYALYWSLMPN